ncbi:LysR family transcriptional activator of mexEF-oprN operon [Brevibacterium paucivorans]|uniref:LysR family transcriptional activator of mexEF-oprN operon n=1 Tax=Brevibacterium paucivorans TaxID=170994 RepID=A0ABS2SMJ7_9MICO|nr:LysR family transcriptional regulator [Brevibacterium paucivorans]MBM7817490.1 LysR family transcriptional activator of mexEF-oprN operon [Brevibacterium paucivorans]
MIGNIDRISLNQVDLNLLVVFQVLMQERNVTRAGYKLNLSQSAVSASLRRLRKLFDDPLFERTRGGMAPTSKALALSVNLSPSLNAIAKAILEDSEFEPWKSSKTFHLAMSDDVEVLFAPWIARQKMDHDWSVGFSIHQTNSHLWKMTIDNPLIDVILTTTPVTLPADVQSEPLFSAEYCCLYNPRQLNLSDPISEREYIETRHARVSFEGQRGWVDDVLSVMGHSRKTLCTTSHFLGLVPLLRDLPVIATVPEPAARRISDLIDVKTSSVPIKTRRFTISATWKVSDDSLPESMWLRQLLKSFVRSYDL